MDYDLFVSYKSEQAAEARAVSEALIARGVRVWFAEYEVLLSNYSRFQPAIDAGIDASRNALLFTNDAWAESRYCQLEVDRVVGRLPDKRILEVCIPRQLGPHRRTPRLARVPSLDYAGSVAEVVKFVASHSDIALAAPTIACPVPAGSAVPLSAGVSLNVGPLRETVMRPGNDTQFFPGDRFHFEDEVGDYEVHLLLSVNPTEAAVTHRQLYTAPLPRDDRELYAAYRDIARPQLERRGAVEQGLHLVRWEGGCHFAVTTGPAEYPDGRWGWERLYVLLLRAPGRREVGELLVSCFVATPPEDDGTGLRTFCPFAAFFDRIVASARFEPAAARQTVRPSAPVSTTTAAFAQPTVLSAGGATCLVQPPLGWLGKTGVPQVLFPPGWVPAFARQPVGRLRRKHEPADVVGGAIGFVAALVVFASWFASYPAAPAPPADAPPDAAVYTLMFSQITWGLVGLLAAVAVVPVAVWGGLKVLMGPHFADYRLYAQRKSGYNAWPAALVNSLLMVVAALAATVWMLIGYGRFDAAGIDLYRYGWPTHYEHAQVRRLAHAPARLSMNTQVNYEIYLIEFDDGSRWTTCGGGRVTDLELDKRAMQFVADRSGKTIEEVPVLED